MTAIAAAITAMARKISVETVVVGIPRLVVGATIFVSIALNLANISARYLFHAPIVWVEEILVFLMVWGIFIGAVLVAWEGRHLKMDLVSLMLPAPFRQIVNFAAAALFVVVCALMSVQSWIATTTMVELSNRSPAAGVPMFLPHAALFLGFAGMLLAVVVRFRAYVTNAFGSETEAATKYAVETFGVFEGAETEPSAPKS